MNFRIDKGRFSVAASGDSFKIRSGENEADRIKELLAKRSSASNTGAQDIGPEDLSSGQDQVISNIQRKIGLASEAIDASLRVREEQVYLAREAASLPYLTRRHSELVAEATDANTELFRIYRYPITGGSFPELTSTNSYGSTDLQSDSSASVSTGGVPVQVGVSYTRLTNATTSEAVVDTVESTLAGLRSSNAGYKAAALKAENLTPKPVEEALPVYETTKDALTSLEEAKDLASSIASRIGEAGTQEESAAKLIEASTSNFDLDKVKQLLS